MPDDDFTPVISDIRDDPRILPDNRIEQGVRVTFTVAGHGPFQVRVLRDGFTETAVRAAMETVVAPIRALGVSKK